jgi:hypothetical protein
MGGQGCERLAFKFPRLFSSMYCYAPAIDDDSANIASNEPGGYVNMLNSVAANYDPMSVWGLPESNTANIIAADLPFHVTVGSADSEAPYTTTLFSQLDTLGISHDPVTSATSCTHDFTCDATFVNGANVDFANAHFPQPVTASRSQTLVNMIGVNTHIIYTATAYNTLSNITNSMAYLGITGIRDLNLFSGAPNGSFYGSLAATGVKFLWNVSGGAACANNNAATYLSSLTSNADPFITTYPGSLIYFEGWNEINNQPVCYELTQNTSGITPSNSAVLDFAPTPLSVQTTTTAGYGSQITVSGTNVTNPTIASATSSTVTISANTTGVNSGVPITFEANQTNPASGILFQQDFFTGVHADSTMSAAGVGVVNFTDSPSYGVAGTADFNNMHFYSCCGFQPYWGLINNSGFASNITIAGKPQLVTETGYYTVPDTSFGVDRPTQAINTMSTIFDLYKLGAPNIYFYELLDEGSDTNSYNNYGFFDANANPKPAATAIHNLTGTVHDSGATALTFSPGALTYSINGAPYFQSSGANAGTFTELFEKSTGTYELVVWNEPLDWNQSAASAIAVPGVPITLYLGTAATTVKVYDPIVSGTALATYSGSAVIPASLSADPIIFEITP